MRPGDGTPAVGQGRPEGLEALDLQPGERVCRVVGDGQVRPEAGVVQLRRLDYLLHDRARFAEVGAHPVHPCVHLDLDVDPARGGVGRPADRLHALVGVHRRHESPPDRLFHGLGTGFGQDQDRREDAGLAQRHALFDECHRQRGGTTCERGDGDGSRTVAVGVGLHHRAQAGRRDERSEQTGVRRDGVEVHLRPGRAPPSFSHAPSTAPSRRGRAGRRPGVPRRSRGRQRARARVRPGRRLSGDRCRGRETLR